MFGYVTLSQEGLSRERQERYRAYYCGLCHSIEKRYGELPRFTLSYDLTFLVILLQSLYEDEDQEQELICLPHPFKKHRAISGPIVDYCADMNLLLAYHKSLDDVRDERSLKGRIGEALLRKAYGELSTRYPEACHAVEKSLMEIHLLEGRHPAPLDELINLTGEMLGAIYAYRRDYWGNTVIRVGQGLGRFIYLMDAYQDLPDDLRRGRFNPLADRSKEDGYEDFIRKSLTLLIAEAAESFEVLPLERDIDLLRNVLYAGCWTQYRLTYSKRHPEESAGRSKEDNHAGSL